MYRHSPNTPTGPRAQAIEAGELVNVTSTAREAGIPVPVAVTHRVWEACIAWSEADTARTGVPQDEDGRLWDVVWLLRATLRRQLRRPHHGPIVMGLYRVPRVGVDPEELAQLVSLVVALERGDQGEPVVTVKLG